MENKNATNIVPFGKYKGQPVEVLAQDDSYLKWLSAQDWFRQRYANIYTQIINNFTEPTETPDHNALQVLFLEDDFCQRFITAMVPHWRNEIVLYAKDMMRTKIRLIKDNILTYQKEIKSCEEIIEKLQEEILKEEQKYKLSKSDFRNYQIGILKVRWEENRDQIHHYSNKIIDLKKRLANLKTVKWSLSFGRNFEVNGIDVVLKKYFRVFTEDDNDDGIDDISDSSETKIEIKPTVSDDYPAILRQMKANKSEVLFTERYTGLGATEKQFVETFRLSKIKVIFRSDVEAVQLGGDGLSGTVTTAD